ncbi:MAG: Bax inhibitor-1/YccA family protein [bacterium]|nr:Bax inhibitor-1/YccA family protein [bacterium]
MASPILTATTFDKYDFGKADESVKTMQVSSAALKALFCALIVLVTSIIASRSEFQFQYFGISILISAVLIGFIHFQPTLACILTPIFSVVQGFILGLLAKLVMSIGLSLPSLLLDIFLDAGDLFTGLEMCGHSEAVFSTICAVIVMCAACCFGVIKAKHTADTILFGAVFGPVLFYFLAFMAKIAGFTFIHIHEEIGYLLACIACSALLCWPVVYCLALDFDNIRIGMLSKVPKVMEWYCAAALIFTLTWCYVEIFKVLAVWLWECRRY